MRLENSYIPQTWKNQARSISSLIMKSNNKYLHRSTQIKSINMSMSKTVMVANPCGFIICKPFLKHNTVLKLFAFLIWQPQTSKLERERPFGALTLLILLLTVHTEMTDQSLAVPPSCYPNGSALDSFWASRRTVGVRTEEELVLRWTDSLEVDLSVLPTTCPLNLRNFRVGFM